MGNLGFYEFLPTFVHRIGGPTVAKALAGTVGVAAIYGTGRFVGDVVSMAKSRRCPKDVLYYREHSRSERQANEQASA